LFGYILYDVSVAAVKRNLAKVVWTTETTYLFYTQIYVRNRSFIQTRTCFCSLT